MIEVHIGPVLDLIEEELETMDEISPQIKQLYQTYGILRKRLEDATLQLLACDNYLKEL